jgi:hypothetical protein
MSASVAAYAELFRVRTVAGSSDAGIHARSARWVWRDDRIGGYIEDAPAGGRDATSLPRMGRPYGPARICGGTRTIGTHAACDTYNLVAARDVAGEGWLPERRRSGLFVSAPTLCCVPSDGGRRSDLQLAHVPVAHHKYHRSRGPDQTNVAFSARCRGTRGSQVPDPSRGRGAHGTHGLGSPLHSSGRMLNPELYEQLVTYRVPTE